MNDLKIKTNELVNSLNTNGFNIKMFQTFVKGETVLFKTVPQDTLIITQYFGSDWDSGVTKIS